MEDWLATFGTFEPNLPANIGVNDYFLPTNRKSLVVSYLDLRLLPHHDFIRVLAFFDRYPFSLPELSLARFSPFLWETWSGVNGVLSHLA